LQVSDIDTSSSIPTIRISDDANGQRIKTAAGLRTIPVHSELIRLGFLSYVRSCNGQALWPDLPRRKGKAGGYFSQWFATLRQCIGIPPRLDFHSFRHTVRSRLTASQVPEPVIDRLLGHQSHGSVGAKTYTHVQIEQFHQAIQTLPPVNVIKIKVN
jgi:integrase